MEEKALSRRNGGWWGEKRWDPFASGKAKRAERWKIVLFVRREGRSHWLDNGVVTNM